MEVDERVLDDSHQLIGIDELAKMIDRKRNTIRVDVTRRPDTLPPKVKLPGSRRVLFKKDDVKKWIDSFTEGEKDGS